MENTKITICVQVYNKEKTIETCLDSVLAQDYDFNDEILIVDDNSTDSTPAILRRYADAHPERIRLEFHPENRGMVPTYWSMLSRARGEYVAILDGDDLWPRKDKIRKQATVLDQDASVSLVGCQYQTLFEGSVRHGPDRSPEQPERIDLERFLEGVWIGQSTMMFRRHVLKNLPKWVLDFTANDKVLQFLCVQQGLIAFINEPLAVFRVHDDGMYSGDTATNQVRWMIDYLKVFDEKTNSHYRHILHRRISRKLYYLSSLYDEEQRWSESREAAREARRYALPVSQRMMEEGRRIIRQLPVLHQFLRYMRWELVSR
jgi:glycosyltransferase involved in cell wall biosynthesis